MFGRVGIFVILTAVTALRAAPSYVDTQSVGGSAETPSAPHSVPTQLVEPDGLPRPAAEYAAPALTPGVIDSAWPADAEPAWAAQAGEWTGQNGPAISLSRLGGTELASTGPAVPMAEPPAAVPLPGALVGGTLTLAGVAAAYYVRRRQQLR